MHLFYLLTEWELKQKDESLLSDEQNNSCKDLLTKHINDELLKSALPDVAVDDTSNISVARTILRIKFAARSTCSPSVDTLSQIIRNCLNKSNQHKYCVRNGKISLG